MLAFLKQKFSRVLILLKKLVPRRKYLFITAGFFIPAFVLFFIFLPDIAFAEGWSMSGFIDGLMWAVGSIMWYIAQLAKDLALYALFLFLDLARYHNFVDIQIVELGWSMVRDVANMFFVVILLVIAFATILGIDSYEMKSTLPKLLLMAILINFSKLICGIILDAAHVFTVTFVNAISAAAGGNFVNAMRLDDLWTKVAEESAQSGSEGKTKDELNSGYLLAGIMSLFMAGTALLAIGAYAVVMLFRIVVLWVLIILSPIAYIAAVLPKTKSFANEWWSKFIQQTLVAPVMVFFIWLFFATLGQGDIQNQMGVMDGAMGQERQLTDSAASNYSQFTGFVVAIAFLFGGLQQIGQKFSQVQGIEAVQSAKSASRTLGEKVSGYRAARAGAQKVGGLAEKGIVGGAKTLSGYNAIKDHAKIQGKKAKRNIRNMPGGKLLSSQGRKAKLKQEDEALKQQDQRFQDEAVTGSSGQEALVGEEIEASKARREKDLAAAGFKDQITGRGHIYRRAEREKIQSKQQEDLMSKMTRDELQAYAAKSHKNGNIDEGRNAGIAALRQGGKSARMVMDAVSKNKGWSEDDLNRKDPIAQMAKFLNTISSQEIGPNATEEDIIDAMEEVEKEMDEEELQDALRNLEKQGYKNAKDDGHISQEGLIKSTVGDDGEVSREFNLDKFVVEDENGDPMKDEDGNVITDYDARKRQRKVADKVNPSQQGGSTWREFAIDDGQTDVDAAVKMLSGANKNTQFRDGLIEAMGDDDRISDIMDRLKTKNKDAHDNLASRLGGYSSSSNGGSGSSNGGSSSGGNNSGGGTSSGGSSGNSSNSSSSSSSSGSSENSSKQKNYDNLAQELKELKKSYEKLANEKNSSSGDKRSKLNSKMTKMSTEITKAEKKLKRKLEDLNQELETKQKELESTPLAGQDMVQEEVDNLKSKIGDINDALDKDK